MFEKLLKKTKLLNLFLLLIIVLASFLRFYQLGTNPPAINWDEAAWGYNAYSIGTDLKDEFGRFLPIDFLESFGDFKPPMYAYLSVIPVKIFGLNEFSTRFASALFGTLTVLITYFLVKTLFPARKSLALITAGVLSVSPWHIMLSRAAFEANVATFFIITGVWLFIKAVHGKPFLLAISIISFVASIYTFNSARVVAPLLVICMSIGYRRELFSQKKHLLQAAVVGILLVLPITNFLLSDKASLRFKEVNIFSDIEVLKRVNKEIENDNHAWWSKIIHNRRIAYGSKFVEHYFDNLSPRFLFTKGDGNPKFSTQDVGQMYLWDLPFLIAGIIFLFRKREKNWWIVPMWLLIGIIPASMARETPHALRIEGTLPTFQILLALGLSQFLIWINSTRGALAKFKLHAVVLIFFALFINILYFLHGYYLHYPREQSGEWQYGYKESLNYVKENEHKYDKIYFTNLLGRPYIYTLFYTKYDPRKFRRQADISRDGFGFVHVTKFGKYNFPEDIPSSDVKGKTLFINGAERVPGTAQILKTFHLLNNKPVLSAYTL